MTPYVWRDPARLTPERRAALADHDAHIAELSKNAGTSGELMGKRNSDRQHAIAVARHAQFDLLRKYGAPVGEAAAAVGIARKTGVRYERDRKEAVAGAGT